MILSELVDLFDAELAKQSFLGILVYINCITTVAKATMLTGGLLHLLDRSGSELEWRIEDKFWSRALLYSLLPTPLDVPGLVYTCHVYTEGIAGARAFKVPVE